MHFVKGVEYVSGYKLLLNLKTGVYGWPTWSHTWMERYSTFRVEMDYFKAASVNSELDTIAWDNGADMSPDFLYEIGIPIAEPEVVRTQLK